MAALIADPPAIFLDEPTSGLDPRGRQALWEQIRTIRDGGAAVVLTTQYLEEADRLADHIVVIDHEDGPVSVVYSFARIHRLPLPTSD